MQDWTKIINTDLIISYQYAVNTHINMFFVLIVSDETTRRNYVIPQNATR